MFTRLKRTLHRAAASLTSHASMSSLSSVGTRWSDGFNADFKFAFYGGKLTASTRGALTVILPIVRRLFVRNAARLAILLLYLLIKVFLGQSAFIRECQSSDAFRERLFLPSCSIAAGYSHQQIGLGRRTYKRLHITFTILSPLQFPVRLCSSTRSCHSLF